MWNNAGVAVGPQGSVISTNTWYHIVATRKKGSRTRIYMNGSLEQTDTTNTNDPSINGTYYPNIGHLQYASSGHWYYMANGSLIDSVNLWNREISADEVTQLYNSGKGAQYPFTGTFSSAINQLGVDNGTLMNGCYLSDGKVGQAFTFDGVNDYISFNTVSNIPIGNDNYTVSIWFNTTSSNTTGGFFGWGNYGTTNQVNAFRLLANGAGFVNYWWANDQNFFTTVDPNTWYNVIAKFDGTNREIWLNGTLVGSVAPSPGHNVPNANNLTIGLTAPFLNEYFPGKIGQVVFYRRGATSQEIQDIYNSGASRFINNNPCLRAGVFYMTLAPY